MNQSKTLPNWLAILIYVTTCMLGASVVFAQVETATMASTSSIAPSLMAFSDGGAHVYSLFATGAILTGVTAVINMLVNTSKLGPINDYIVRKKIKWVRLVAALAAGFLAGLGAGLAQGMPWYGAAASAFLGLGSGGMAVVAHELYNVARGKRG